MFFISLLHHVLSSSLPTNSELFTLLELKTRNQKRNLLKIQCSYWHSIFFSVRCVRLFFNWIGSLFLSKSRTPSCPLFIIFMHTTQTHFLTHVHFSCIVNKIISQTFHARIELQRRIKWLLKCNFIQLFKKVSSLVNIINSNCYY